MAKKKSSKSSSDIKIRVGRRKIKAPLWVFLTLLIVSAVAVAGYFTYVSFQKPQGSSSRSSSASKSASSSSLSLPSGVAPIDIYL
jgi:flagellar basal body-associated protein FliL